MIAHCPKCKELVTLPTVHVAGARVVCPHCDEVMSLDDVARQAGSPPPEMKLVLEEVTQSFASSHLAAINIVPDEFSDPVVRVESETPVSDPQEGVDEVAPGAAVVLPEYTGLPDQDALSEPNSELESPDVTEPLEDPGIEEDEQFDGLSGRESSAFDGLMDEQALVAALGETPEPEGEDDSEEETLVSFDESADLANQILGGEELSDQSIPVDLISDDLISDEPIPVDLISDEPIPVDLISVDLVSDEEFPVDLISDEQDGGEDELDVAEADPDVAEAESDDIESWLTDEEDGSFEVMPEEDAATLLEADRLEGVDTLDDAASFADDVTFEDGQELSGDEEVTLAGEIASEAAADERVTADEHVTGDQVATRPAADFFVKPPPRKSSLGWVAKLAVGSLAACLAVQLVLWWLPGDWKQDPLGLAKALPGFASFLAPFELRQDRTVALRPSFPPTPVDERREIPERESVDDSGGDEVPPAPESADVASGGERGEPTTRAPNDLSGVEGMDAGEVEDLNGDDLSVDDLSVDDLSGDDLSGDDLSVEDLSGEGIPEPVVGEADFSGQSDLTGGDAADPTGTAFEDVQLTPPSSLGAPLGVERIMNAPQVSTYDLSGSFVKARTAHQRLANATGNDERRAAMIEYYLALCELGRSVAFATREAETVQLMDEIAKFMEVAGEDQQTAAIILRSAAAWFTQPTVRQKFGSEGIALYGEVQRVQQVGDLTLAYLRQPRAKSGEVIVPVLATPIAADGGPSPFVEGGQVFVLGTVVVDAPRAIRDMQVSEPTVVWSGYAVRVGP